PVEIVHSNGGITVSGATEWALVATSNGPIAVELTRVARDTPMSLITTNGDVVLTLPRGTDATLVVDAALRVDADVPLRRASKESGRLVRLDLGRGGPTIRISTDNGVVRLRASGASPR